MFRPRARRDREPAEGIAARILEGMINHRVHLYSHGDQLYTVTETLRLPPEYHDKRTRLAPIHVTGLMQGIGTIAVIQSGKWEKYTTVDGRLEYNTSPKGDVWYKNIGILSCGAQVSAEEAATIGTDWLRTVTAELTEREPSAAELEAMHSPWGPDHSSDVTRFYFARATDVDPPGRFVSAARNLLDRFMGDMNQPQ